MGMCYAWTTSVNSAKLLKPSLPWGGNMGRRLLLLHFISRVRAIVYRNLVVLPMAQNFIESIRDCLDHIPQRRRDNGWGGLHIEKLALGSQGNELANGFSGVGGKSECCYAPIQSRLIGMALRIHAHHFASKEICCSGSPTMSIFDVSWI